MDKDKVLGLAKLARIEMGEDEAEKLSKEFEAILGYVGEVGSVTSEHQHPTIDSIAIKNVLREDLEPHESGIYTESILKQAPTREGNYIRVKKIL